jgi:proteasome component ECM29
VLEKALAGKTWDGKEVLLTALVKFARAAQALWTARPELGILLKVSFFFFFLLFSLFFSLSFLGGLPFWAVSTPAFFMLSLFLSRARLAPRLRMGRLTTSHPALDYCRPRSEAN